MILIISDEADHSTLDVINWLMFFSANFYRINGQDEIKILFLNTEYFIIEHNFKILDSRKISSCWFRRGSFNIPIYLDSTLHIPKGVQRRFFEQETHVITQFLHAIVERNFSLNNFKNKNLNKLGVLSLAKSCGLVIPDSILSSKINLVKNTEYICKAVSPGAMIKDELGKWWNLYTNDYEEGNILSSFPIFIQCKIKKKFEIRSFYIENTFFSMAIFSQDNEKTMTDFRRYDDENNNVRVPFILPKNVENKLRKLFWKLGLNSGSVDLIFDQNSNYIFLEINPIGQFGMVSQPCNYNIEKHIASTLIKNKNNLVYEN